jgi:site-specific recombinase
MVMNGLGSQNIRLRMDSCQRLIHDVSQRLAGETVNPKIVEQLSRLDELLSYIDHEAVTEADLARIETCTNQLMGELGVLFEHQQMGSLYDVVVH